MSHTSKITGVSMTDAAALAAAAVAMGIPAPAREKVRLYDGTEHEGMAIRLPGWQYPVVLTEGGEAVLDNYNGAWGSMELFDRFHQHYVVAVAHGAMPEHQFTTEELPSGDLRVVFFQ